MQVGSVDFKVNLDLNDLDKQLKVASKQIQYALNDNASLNLKINSQNISQVKKEVGHVFKDFCIPFRFCDKDIKKEFERINKIHSKQAKYRKKSYSYFPSTNTNNSKANSGKDSGVNLDSYVNNLSSQIEKVLVKTSQKSQEEDRKSAESINKTIKATSKQNIFQKAIDGLVLGFGQNISTNFADEFLKGLETKSGFSSSKSGKAIGNFVGSGIKNANKIGFSLGQNILKEIDLDDFSGKLKDAFSEAIVQSLDESMTHTELFASLKKNLGKALTTTKIQSSAEALKNKALNPQTYTKAAGLSSGPGGSVLQAPVIQSLGKKIAPNLDNLIKEIRSENLEKKAIPLVLKRVQEILNTSELGSLTDEAISKGIKRSEKLKGKVVQGVDASKLAMGKLVGVDAPAAIKPETKELIITIGGYAGDVGHASGLRIAGDLTYQFNQMKKKDVAAIGVLNPDTNLKPGSKKEAATKMQALLSSLAKPNIRGYNKDSVELASQAVSALLSSPDLQVKLLGESGGGFAVEEAAQILQSMGFGDRVQAAGFGTPNFIGGLNPSNYKKYLGKDPAETLGYETHQVYAPAGFADVSIPEQNLTGLTGHPYEHYAPSEAFQSFVFNKAQVDKVVSGADLKQAADIKSDIKQVTAILNDIKKIPMETSREIKSYLEQVALSLSKINFDPEVFGETEAKISREETENILKTINSELENVDIIAQYKAALSRGESALEKMAYSEVDKNAIDDTIKLLMKESSKVQAALLEIAQTSNSVLSKSLIKHFGDFQIKLKTWAKSSKKEMQLDVVAKGAEQKLEELIKNFDKNTAIAYSTAIKEIITDFDMDLAKNPDIALENLEKLNNIQSLLNDLIGETIKEVINKVEENIVKSVEPLQNNTENQKLIINEEAFENIIKLLKEKTSQLTYIAQNFQKFDDSQLLESIIQNLNAIKGIEELANQKIPEKINGKKTQNVLKGYKGQSQARVNQIAEELLTKGVSKETLSKLEEMSLQIGRSIVEGVAKGVEEEEVKAIALDIARPIIKIIEEQFEIRSPSRWAEEIGQRIVEGLGNGLDTAEQMATNIFGNLSASMENQLRDIEIGDIAANSFGELEDASVSTFVAFKSNILEIVSSSFLLLGAVAIFSTFQEAITSLGKDALATAIEFEKITTATQFIVGSASGATAKIEELRESARNLGIDQMAVVESYNSLAAATRSTPLEGRNTDLMADALNQAAAAFSLSAEQLDGAFTAIQQIAGKGVVSAEELRGQLAERIPGAFQIAARAMKVSEQELFQMMSSGALSATDFLPALARQLKIETFSGIEAASQTAGFQLQKIQNYLQDMQITIGNKLLPNAKIAMKSANIGLKLLSENLGIIFNIIDAGLTFALVHFAQTLSPILKLVAPIIQGAIAKGMRLVIERLTAGAIAATSFGKALFVAQGALSAINNSAFLKIFVAIEGIKFAYSTMRTVFGSFDLSDNPLFAEQTIWDDLAKRIKKTTESIKKDMKGLNKSVADIDFSAAFSRELKPQGAAEGLAYSALNTNPFIGAQDRRKRREEALRAVNEGKVPSKILGINFQRYDRQGRIASLASIRENDYLMDFQERSEEIDKMLNSQKVMDALTLAKQGTGELVKITSLDNQISQLTALKSLLDPKEVGKRANLSKQIQELQDSRELLSTDYVVAQSGYLSYIKTIDAELETVTDPQAINQLTAARAAAQKLLDLMGMYEAENGPINIAKKFALALQELSFAFDSISQRAERANTAIQRGFAQQKLAAFSTSYFAETELALKESTARLKVIEIEANLASSTLKSIAANLENNPSYREALNYIKKKEEKSGYRFNPADIEYLKEKTASSQSQDLINAFDAEIKIRTQMAELENKLLEKDELALEIQNQRQSLVLEKLDRQKEIADITQQLVEARDRQLLAEMNLSGRSSGDISATQSLMAESGVNAKISNLKVDKIGLEGAFKKGEISAREYGNRINQVNLELANLNAELAEAKIQSRDALSDRLLAGIDKQLAAIDHRLSVNQINRESNDLVAYENDVLSLSQAYIALNQSTRSSSGEIANLTAQLHQSRQALEALINSGFNSESVRDRIAEVKRQIETQSAELVRAQIQAAQSIKEAQDAAIIADIDKAFQNAQHQNSIVDLNQEYSKLDAQLKSLKSGDTSPLSKFNEVVAQSESNIEGLNRELEINKNLLNDLSTSGVNNPEIRDRIEEVGKQVEAQEKQLAIARKQSEVDIFEARYGMLDEIAGKEEEISKKKEEDFLKQLEIQSKQFDHDATIEDLNKEYKKVQNQFENLGKESPMLDFQNAVDDSKDKVLVLKRELKQTLNTLQQLKNSSIKSETITEKIQDAEKELEVQKLKLKIAQEQSKIDISQAETALKDALSPEKLNERNKELENIILKIQKIEEKLSLINIESEKQSVVAEKILNQYSQRLDTLSEISGLFEQINIYSENLFDIEMAMNNKKSRMELKDLKRKLIIEEDILDINREKFLLERKQSEIESDAAIKNAEDALKEAKAGHDSNAIKNAEMALAISKEERDILRDKRKTEDLIYSKEKEILAIRSQSEIKLKKAEMANLSYKNSLDVVAFAVKQINQQFDEQRTYIDSYKELFAAQGSFLQQVKENKLKELDFGKSIIQQLKQEDISEHLKRELEAQLSALGISRSDSEADVLLEAFKIENKLAEERLELLKQQQTIDKTLLDIDLKRAELDARSAVVQAQILDYWGQMMGVDSAGLVKEAIANLDFTRQQGELARQAQGIGQASEINQQLMDDWFRKLQQRQEIAGADGYSGGLGNIDAKPKLIKPNTKIPKFNPTDYELSEFDEEAMIPEFMKPKPEYQASDFQDKRYVPDFSPLASQVGETNSILTEMRELIKQQNNKKTDNIKLTVVSSDAVVDAGKILNDITKPY